MMLRERFQSILESPKAARVEVYGLRLASAAVFGSVARGTMRTDSDVDLLILVEKTTISQLDVLNAMEKRHHPAVQGTEATAAPTQGTYTISPMYSEHPRPFWEARYRKHGHIGCSDSAPYAYDQLEHLALVSDLLGTLVPSPGAPLAVARVTSFSSCDVAQTCA